MTTRTGGLSGARAAGTVPPGESEGLAAGAAAPGEAVGAPADATSACCPAEVADGAAGGGWQARATSKLSRQVSRWILPSNRGPPAITADYSMTERAAVL